MTFRPLPDRALDRLCDADLVAYIADARRSGDSAAARRALAVMTWGWQPYVELRVGGRVPREHVEAVSSAVLDTAGVNALAGRATFSGSTVRDFRGWLDRIIARRVADHYRGAEHQRGRRLALAEEAGEDEAGVQLTARDDTVAIADQLLVWEALAGMAHDARIAAEMTELQGHSAQEVVDRLGRRNPNWVYKNAERFRARVAAAAGHQTA